VRPKGAEPDAKHEQRTGAARQAPRFKGVTRQPRIPAFAGMTWETTVTEFIEVPLWKLLKIADFDFVIPGCGLHLQKTALFLFAERGPVLKFRPFLARIINQLV
jgi:hypothetical protein